MAINVAALIQPPHPQDAGLVDYTHNLQTVLLALDQQSHKHLGTNGVLSAFPTATQGNQGDIVIAVVSGTAYLCFKTDKTHWFKIAGIGV